MCFSVKDQERKNENKKTHKLSENKDYILSFCIWKMSKLARKILIKIKVILGTVLVKCGEMSFIWIVTT